ncbi:MAG: nicotinate (nicotinamide) nucleotide adenylyltransferase [Provencibacterium sp.]|nr:nicotinate (nicotinamide) nucleotide adenylyltransferase [Provencibacterium sp.]
MKKIALFGGAFNPIHQGHINLALRFDVRIKFDEILLIPSHISPHKDSRALISGEDRLAMCRLVAERHPRFLASDMELRREGKSFTIDTVQALRSLYPDGKFYLIVGSDMFLSIDSWYRAEELMRLVTLCAAAREKGEYATLIHKQLALDTQGVKSVVCEIDELPVSSSAIRERLHNGLSVEGMLPDYVLDYIQAHRLYRE